MNSTIHQKEKGPSKELMKVFSYFHYLDHVLGKKSKKKSKKSSP